MFIKIIWRLNPSPNGPCPLQLKMGLQKIIISQYISKSGKCIHYHHTQENEQKIYAMENSFDTLQSNKKITKMTKCKKILEFGFVFPKRTIFPFKFSFDSML